MIDLEFFAPLSAAEQKLVEQANTPNRITIGDGTLPDTETDTNRIRAELIRFLMLGRSVDVRLHDKGMRLRGAWIVGALDLQGCDCARDLTLSCCNLADPMNFVNATMRGVHISSCQLSGISADNAVFSGSIYIRAGTHVAGEISLSGTRIAGDLQICDAILESPTQDAIFAPSLRVEGSVFLGNYPYSETTTSLKSTGMLFFSSARVDHDFFLTNTAISPTTSAEKIGVFDATEEHGGGIALSLARARIGGILYLEDNQITRGIVNLAGADVARLKDEPVGPGANYPIRLDGFTYTDFSRHTEIDLKARLEWLERRPDDMPFVSQPFEQLASVLLKLGRRNDARTVLMHKERLLRAENRRLTPSVKLSAFIYPFSWAYGQLMYWTVGYGYRPGRAVLLAIVLILGLGVFFDRAWHAGDMTPNSAPILVSSDWIAATQSHPENPAAFWSSKGQGGQDWETFNAFAYAADLAIPLVTLGQETAWAPSTSRSDLGRIGWWVRWFAKAIGWIVTALGAAAITGVIRND